MAEHFKAPLKVTPSGVCWSIFDGADAYLASIPSDGRAVAVEIVTAVNEHEALVKVKEAAAHYLNDHADTIAPDYELEVVLEAALDAYEQLHSPEAQHGV